MTGTSQLYVGDNPSFLRKDIPDASVDPMCLDTAGARTNVDDIVSRANA